jgi:hypothetical protein
LRVDLDRTVSLTIAATVLSHQPFHLRDRQQPAGVVFYERVIAPTELQTDEPLLYQRRQVRLGNFDVDLLEAH